MEQGIQYVYRCRDYHYDEHDARPRDDYHYNHDDSSADLHLPEDIHHDAGPGNNDYHNDHNDAGTDYYHYDGRASVNHQLRSVRYNDDDSDDDYARPSG